MLNLRKLAALRRTRKEYYGSISVLIFFILVASLTIGTYLGFMFGLILLFGGGWSTTEFIYYITH